MSDGYFWVRMFEIWIKCCAHHIAATSENGFIEAQGLWREDLHCLSLLPLDGICLRECSFLHLICHTSMLHRLFCNFVLHILLHI